MNAPDLRPKMLGSFIDFNDWVTFAHRTLTNFTGNNGEKLSAICVDSKGRRCNIGIDFMRARDEGTFPVWFFTECQLAEKADAA